MTAACRRTETFDHVHRPAITMDWTSHLKDGASFTTAEWTAPVFGDAAVNTLFVAADGAGAAVTNGVAANGGVTFAPLIGTVLSVVMWTYTMGWTPSSCGWMRGARPGVGCYRGCRGGK